MNKFVSFLNENIEKEEKIASELIAIIDAYKIANKQEQEFLEETSKHVINQAEIITDSIGGLLDTISLEKSGKKKIEDFQRILTSRGYVIIKKGDRTRFSRELNLGKSNVKRESKASKETGDEKTFEIQEKSKMPSKFSIFCSKVFKGPSKLLSRQIGFLDKDLKRADMPYIITSYISLILGIAIISFFVLILLALVLSFKQSGLVILRNVIIAFFVNCLFFVFLVYYPRTQASSNSRKLDNEMPFALANMAAIASSNIEPAKIFYIMARAQEYKVFSQQMKKVVNQMNIYGYNLTTALRNVSKLSGNRKFSEFLNGMASTILSGGNLTVYIHEKSRDTMLDYKLARERYSVSIGMYSDIYTALLIAAPLILMLILSFMGSIGQNLGGISISMLANIGIIAIIALNILFILFLHLTQPES